MKYLVLLFSLVLAACSTTPVSYTAQSGLSDQKAAEIIEQVILEQPKKYRPDSVAITDRFLEVNRGFVTQNSGASVGFFGHRSFFTSGHLSSRGKTKEIIERAYFSSIDHISLGTRDEWYVVEIHLKTKVDFKKIYSRSQTKAQRLVDALEHFKNKGQQADLFAN